LSYVVNCGMKDVDGTATTATTPGVPRDWAANGVFFDLYTDNPLVAGVPQPASSIGKEPTVPTNRLAGGTFSDKFGIFADKQPGVPLVGMSSAYIARHDGTSQTCLLSENVDAGEYIDFTEAKVGLVWDATGRLDLAQDPPSLKPPDDNMRINVGAGLSELSGKPGLPQRSPDDTTFARPSSWHPRGCNMAFCDGRVRFVSDMMDYYVYCLLMSTNGAAVRLPGTDRVLPHFDRVPAESWYLE
jgi:prepilin-type processing-associated H-X9-DG protein